MRNDRSFFRAGAALALVFGLAACGGQPEPQAQPVAAAPAPQAEPFYDPKAPGAPM